MGPVRLAVGTGMQAVIEHTLAQPGNEEVRSVNAVVGETNDASLNDIRAHYTLTPAMLRAAIPRQRPPFRSDTKVGVAAGRAGWLQAPSQS